MVPALSASANMRDAPVPSSSLWSSTRIASVCLCLSCTREPRTGISNPVVSDQGWAEGLDHLPWPVSNTPRNAAQEGLSLLWGYVAGWWSTCCPNRIPTSCSADLLSRLSACRAYLCLGLFLLRYKALHFSLMNFTRFLSPLCSACPNPSDWWHNHLVYQPLLPLQTCWGCALLHLPGH